MGQIRCQGERLWGNFVPLHRGVFYIHPPRTIDYSKDAPNEVNINAVRHELYPLITGSKSILCLNRSDMRSIVTEKIIFDTHIRREISLIGSSTKYLNRGLRNMIKEKIEGRHKSEAMLEAKKRAISAQERINKEKIRTLNTARSRVS